MLFVSLFKSSDWLPYVLIITFSLATLKPVYNVTLFGNYFFIFCEYQLAFHSIPSLKMYHTMFATDGFVAFT